MFLLAFDFTPYLGNLIFLLAAGWKAVYKGGNALC